jgi:chemotaxis protein histidine kinase CheA
MTPDRPNPPRYDSSAALQQLRERYRASAPQLVSVFRELAAQLAADPQSAALADAVRSASHRLRGTAGSYGFDRASQLSAALEDRATRWVADAEADASARTAIVSTFADALEVAFASP